MAIDQWSEVLEKVRELPTARLMGLNVKIYLFGSWARKQQKTSSDIDLAIWYEDALPPGTLTDLCEIFEDSSIPYRVEIVDLTESDFEFHDPVLQKAIEWTV